VYDFLLVINTNLGPISLFLRYGDLLAKNHNFFVLPAHLVPLHGMTPFELMNKLYGSWNESSRQPTVKIWWS